MRSRNGCGSGMCHRAAKTNGAASFVCSRRSLRTRKVCMNVINNDASLSFRALSHWSLDSNVSAKARISQPHPGSHPHLLKENEVTYGITKEEYAKRRRKLMDSLHTHNIIIIPAARHHLMTNDIPYRYRQNTDFLYLTGFHEPNSVLVLEKRSNSNEPYFVLFLEERDAANELWNGPRTGVERAGSCFGCDEALPLTSLSSFLEKLPSSKRIAFLDITTEDNIAQAIYQNLSTFNVTSLAPVMDRIRVIKSLTEVNIMKKSTEISCAGFIHTMKNTKDCTNEAQLEAHMEFYCKMHGAERLAYPPVVSNGISNNIIHYINNDNILGNGNLILMDAGGEFNNFASDITRSWPVSGKFTEPQMEVYSEVLHVLKECTEFVRSDITMSLDILHTKSVDFIVHSLKKLGLVSSYSEGMKEYKRFYPHTVGHWVGMEVHDCKTVAGNIQFQPGMFVTVEPGLYIPDEPDIPKHLRGIGIRIEDDVLVTEAEPYVFTSAAPKEIDHLEKILNES